MHQHGRDHSHFHETYATALRPIVRSKDTAQLLV